MFDFHKDKRRYFDMQYKTAREYLLPFISAQTPVTSHTRVLEIGCAEAGVLLAFRELGCDCVGIELSKVRTETASQYHSEFDMPGAIRFINKNIYEIDIAKDIGHTFDVIILKDVIEHIPDQATFIPKLQDFLTAGGLVFFGFPPWYMPFGGHQQICKSSVLSKLPYFHLLPAPIYRWILKIFGESPIGQKNLMEIKDTGISIERFERIVKSTEMHVEKKQLWLLNPIYKYKFGKGPVAQSGLVGAIPFVRNFLTTAVYYVIRKPV